MTDAGHPQPGSLLEKETKRARKAARKAADRASSAAAALDPRRASGSTKKPAKKGKKAKKVLEGAGASVARPGLTVRGSHVAVLLEAHPVLPVLALDQGGALQWRSLKPQASAASVSARSSRPTMTPVLSKARYSVMRATVPRGDSGASRKKWKPATTPDAASRSGASRRRAGVLGLLA